MRVFVDTNIVIDLICTREPFAKDAVEIFKKGYEKKIELYLSSLTVINTMYVCRKYGYNKDDVVMSLKKLCSFCNITSIGSNEIHKSFANIGSDFEDTVQLQSAVSSGADCIVTRDKTGYDQSPIQVFEPKEFFITLHSDSNL